MKTRLVFSVAVMGVSVGIGSASVALAQEGSATAQDAGTATTAELPASVAAESGDTKREAASEPKPARIKLYPHEVHGRTISVGKKLHVTGKLIPYVANQRVQVVLARSGKVVRKANAKVRPVHGNPQAGEFKFHTPRLLEGGAYKLRAHHARTGAQLAASRKAPTFRISYPDLDPGDSGPAVKLLNRVLDKQGYYPSNGSGYSARTSRAILAFRKVNSMARNYQATPGIFKTLASGKGGFKLHYPGAGKHVETDLSRQVMVLADNGKARYIFPISSGKPSTPTIRGRFSFYRKDAGFNSLGMYYSVYFRGGYATHGYHSVPTYPASHGCLRNPIPDSRFIYNWIDLGDSIYVYN